MSDPALADVLREKIISDPEVILEDRDLMRALIAANERAMGANIVDLRGIAMQRLEERLDRLEDTHRSVIAAAYENLAGTTQIHRAVLKLLDPTDFEAFLNVLHSDVAEILRLDSIRLVLETMQTQHDPVLRSLGEVLRVAEPGFIDTYMTAGRGGQLRPVVLRQTLPEAAAVYGEAAEWIRSEALMRLDFGPGRLPGLLVMGAQDPQQFKPSQGTDLLGFFAGAFERAMRRWLA
ncbi:DUF484 family protein [Sedimentimonas flavescens]|uniref:DUF484 family protein n=1 Tax=Sedimentimonas flavescens TaxID=2851012 RepID=UPI001C4A6787|nr:DUF484 family protein [Sedimentimonas flavescens]MBW0156897.1 DUF484 family protein [Sedimentimonas flavescens]